MGTVFLTNPAAVAGKYKWYDVLSAKLDFEIWIPFTFKKAVAT